MNTLTLSNTGFVELKPDEALQVSGGFAPLVILATACVSMILFQAMENPERILNGFLDSFS